MCDQYHETKLDAIWYYCYDYYCKSHESKLDTLRYVNNHRTTHRPPSGRMMT